MPKQNKSQEIGRTGERWFVSQLPANWIFQPPLEDVGIDGIVVICEPGKLNGSEFRVQVKSSIKWRVRNDAIILKRIKRSSLRYWVTGFTPTLIVAYETSTNLGFCAWANQLIATRTEDLKENSGLVTLEIPMRTKIDSSAWDQIRIQISGISAALGRNLLIAQRSLPFLRAINALSGAVKGLYFAQSAEPKEPERTEEQKELISELEIMCHRDVVRSILALEKDLRLSGISIGGLTEYASEYTERCSTFVKEFKQLLHTDNQPINCTFALEGLVQNRPAMMNSIVSAIHELTQGAVRATENLNEESGEKSDAKSE